MAGKVTIGLSSHGTRRVSQTRVVVHQRDRSLGNGEKHPAYTPLKSMAHYVTSGKLMEVKDQHPYTYRCVCETACIRLILS